MDDMTPEVLATLPLTIEECDALAAAIDKTTATRFGAKVELRMRGDDGSGALALVMALPRLCVTVRLIKEADAAVKEADAARDAALAEVEALKAERMMLDSQLTAALDAATKPADTGGED